MLTLANILGNFACEFSDLLTYETLQCIKKRE